MNRFRPYFHYLRPLRGQLVLGMICLGIYSFATGYWLPKIVPDVFGPIFKGGEKLRSVSEVALLSLSIPAVFLLRGLAGYASTYLFQFIGTRVLEALRLDFFRKLQSLPLSYLQKHPAGEFTSRAMNDAQQVQYVITALASDGLKHPLTLIAAISYVAYTAAHTHGVGLAVACLAVVPLCVFPVRFVGKKILRRAHQAQAQIGSL